MESPQVGSEPAKSPVRLTVSQRLSPAATNLKAVLQRKASANPTSTTTTPRAANAGIRSPQPAPGLSESERFFQHRSSVRRHRQAGSRDCLKSETTAKCDQDSSRDPSFVTAERSNPKTKVRKWRGLLLQQVARQVAGLRGSLPQGAPPARPGPPLLPGRPQARAGDAANTRPRRLP